VAAATSGSTASSTSVATSTGHARVAAIHYDPHRNARLALLYYSDGEKRYILAPAGIAIGQTVVAGPDAPIETGNALPLSSIPLGSSVHNVELYAGRGGQMVRTAGGSAQVVAKEGDYVALKLPSTEVRLVRRECYATLGEVGNAEAAQHQPRQGGSHPLAGPPPGGARQRDEPLRSPPRRWRRSGTDRPLRSGHPLGQARPGPTKPASATSRATGSCCARNAAPPSGAVADAIPDELHRSAVCLIRHGTLTQKRPLRRRPLLRKIEAQNSPPTTRP
jgi:hypothetical protein